MKQPLSPAEFHVNSAARPAHTVDCRTDGPRFHVELRNYRWPEPVEGDFTTSSCMIQLTMRRGTLRPRALAIGGIRMQPSAPLGRVLLLPPHTPLMIRCDAGDADMLCCSLPADMLSGLLPGLLFDETGAAAWEPRILQAALDVRCAAVLSCLNRIAEEIRRPGLASNTLIEAALTIAMIELARHLRGGEMRDASSRGKLAPWQLRRIEQHVAEAGAAAVTVTDIARSCGIGPRHLMRLFRATTGTTLGSTITQSRIRTARELLSEPGMSIKQAAHRCGFQSAAAFSAAFRRDTGMSPRAFRQRGWPSGTSRSVLRK